MYQDNFYTSGDSSSRLGEGCNFTYSIRGPVVEGDGTRRGGIIFLELGNLAAPSVRVGRSYQMRDHRDCV